MLNGKCQEREYYLPPKLTNDLHDYPKFESTSITSYSLTKQVFLVHEYSIELLHNFPRFKIQGTSKFQVLEFVWFHWELISFFRKIFLKDHDGFLTCCLISEKFASKLKFELIFSKMESKLHYVRASEDYNTFKKKSHNYKPFG